MNMPHARSIAEQISRILGPCICCHVRYREEKQMEVIWTSPENTDDIHHEKIIHDIEMRV